HAVGTRSRRQLLLGEAELMNSYLIRQNLLRLSVLRVVLAPLTVGICQFHLRRQELDPMAGVVQDGESDEHVISIACHDAHAGSDDTAAVFPCWTGHLHLLAERQLVDPKSVV